QLAVTPVEYRSARRPHERVASVRADRQTGELVVAHLCSELEPDVVEEEPVVDAQDRDRDDAVLVERAGSPDVEHRLAGDADDPGRLVGIDVDEADASDHRLVARAGVDPQDAVVAQIRRRRERVRLRPVDAAVGRIDEPSLLPPHGPSSSSKNSCATPPPPNSDLNL